MTSWILFVWIGAYQPVTIDGFTSYEKCMAIAPQIKSPYIAEERVKFQCVRVDK